MFGIGGFELFIILVFGFLIFGPEKLPEIAKIVGKGIARFRQAQDEMNDVIKSTDIYDPNSDEPFKDPMQALDKLAQHQEDKRKAKEASASAQKTAKPAKASSEAQPAAPSADEGQAGSQEQAEAPRQESFTERKARYERERAARKAAEGKAASELAENASPEEAQKPVSDAKSAPAAAEGGDE